MKKSNKIDENNLLAAEAVVNVALFRLKSESKLSFHPRLKQLIAEEIAADPSRTMDLFSPNFIDSFMDKTISKNT